MSVEQHQRRTRTEILTARQGFVAGMVGGLTLALVAGALSSAAGDGLWTPVNAAGSFFLGVQPIPTGMAGAVSYLGLAVMLVVAAGTYLFGIVGALFAVPATALVNSVVRHLVEREGDGDEPGLVPEVDEVDGPDPVGHRPEVREP